MARQRPAQPGALKLPRRRLQNPHRGSRRDNPKRALANTESRMSNNRTLSFAALLVIAPLLGACSEGGDNGETEPTASAPAPEAASTLGACDLLTAGEAEAVVGGAVGEPKAGAPVSSGTVRLTDCTWIDTGSGRSVTIILRRSQTADNTAEAIAGVRAQLATAGPVEDVDGLADSAFWGSDQLHVFYNGRDYLTVSVVGFRDARSAAHKVAETAIGHL
jgi:hypothetical protein